MKTKIRLSQLLVIGCFFGFFLFCLVWGLAQPDRPSSAAENRSLAQRPAMRRVVTDFGGFAKDFESYAADQFPDREQLIGVYTALELAQGKKFARKAYCLQDSWLLTKPTPTKPADLSALQQALAQAVHGGSFAAAAFAGGSHRDVVEEPAPGTAALRRWAEHHPAGGNTG